MSSRTPYVDPDGDGIEVETTPISVRFFRTGGGDYAGLDRDAVLRLHAALGEWLYPVHTPEWANKSLIEQMIERAVKDQVAAVLPLHLKPVAYVHGRNCSGQLFCQDANGVQVIDCQSEADPEPHDAGNEECRCIHDASAHGPIGCTASVRLGPAELVCRCRARVSDPEPHDVGHAEEPAAGPCDALLKPEQILAEVHDCGYVWAAHRAPFGVKGPETNRGRLMSELPVRTRPRPICVSCGHGWGQHYSGICWGEPGTAMQSEPGCTCTRERPGTAGTP